MTRLPHTCASQSKNAAIAPRPASNDPASTFPAPEPGADGPVASAMGLPVPDSEDETKDADADAVTLVGLAVLDV